MQDSSANFSGLNSHPFGGGAFDPTSLVLQHPPLPQALDKSDSLPSFDVTSRVISQETDAIAQTTRRSLAQGKREERSLSSRKDLNTGLGVSLSATVGDKSPDVLLNGETVWRKEVAINDKGSLKEPGETIATARTIGLTKQTRELTGDVGKSDRIDFYRFDLLASSSFNLRIKEDSNRIDTVLLDASGQVVDEPLYRRGGELGRIKRSLEAGTYYVKVTGKGDVSNYQMSMSKEPGSSLGNAQFMPITATPRIWKDSVSGSDRADMYRFDLAGNSTFSLNLKKLKANADMALLDSSGKVMQISQHFGKKNEAIGATLEAGTYYVRVIGRGRDTPYRLELSTTLKNPRKSKSGQDVEDAGVFTVGAPGEVRFDYLFDGSPLQGELAIFNLSGMGQYDAGSKRYIQEAALRALRNSPGSGYVVVMDEIEAAKFGGNSGSPSFNLGKYLGSKTFLMNPGANFGIMFVSNGGVPDILSDPSFISGERPLFSIPKANVGGEDLFSQITSGESDSNSFVFEDQPFTKNSDYDYNDLMFQMRGATGQATALDDLIEPPYDWRQTDLGKALLAYTQPYTTLSTPKIGESVSADLMSQLTSKAGTFVVGEERTKAATTQGTFTQPEIEQWLRETKQRLTALKSQGGGILNGFQEKIDSANGEITTLLSSAKTKFQSDIANIRSSVDDIKAENSTNRDDVLKLIKTSWDEYGNAIGQVNISFEDIRKTYDELKPRYEELGGSSAEWAQQYKDLLDVTQKGFNSLWGSGNRIEQSSLNQLDNIANQSNTLDGELDKALKGAQDQYDILQSDAAIKIMAAGNRYQAIKDAWEDWISDTESKIDVWAKILAYGNQGDNASSNSSHKRGLPLVGVIDTGFIANDPDLDYSRIVSGKDRVEGDNDSLVLYENVHGTQILKLIAATRSNGIGTDGINDQSPVWLGRAVGSDNWAQSLVEFVDAARTLKQTNAIVNLSFDLTQTNADGSISPRYQLTALERAALTYAQQNHVLIVVAAGNEDANLVSALGQAGQEFDNIITVGAAEGLDRASYSNYGNGIDIVAQDREGEASGTSISTAKVTGAVSLIWAANPQLNYRQVIAILKDTATDVSSPNWDAGTGFGLLNIPAAVYLAKATEPEPYESLGSILFKKMFETLTIPEGDRQMLQELYYYVDLETKLTGETWNGGNGAKATEQASFLWETVVIIAAGYALLSGGSPDDTAVQQAQEERNVTGAKWNKNLSDDKTAIDKIVYQAGVDLLNKNNQITEALRNGASPVEIEALYKEIPLIKDKLAIDYASAQQKFLADQQQAGMEIAAADANLEQAKKDFESGNDLFTRIGSKFIGVFQRAGSWIEQIPARYYRLGESALNLLKNSIPRVWDGDWWKSFAQVKSYAEFFGRLGKLSVSAVELTPTVEFIETALDFFKPNTRPLTDRELAIAKSVFGENGLDYSLVRIDNSALFGIGAKRTTFHTINSTGSIDDVTLVHELTHVWQYERDGAVYAPEALIAQITLGRDGAYNYGGKESLVELDASGTPKLDRNKNYITRSSINPSTYFNNLNREQQGQFVQDYYLIRENDRSKDVNDPTVQDNKYLSIYAYILVTEGVSTRPESALTAPDQINIGIVS